MGEQNNWAAGPGESVWHGCVIAAPPEGDTDYFYGYSAEACAPDVNELVPAGWARFELELNGTPLGSSPGVKVKATWDETSGTWRVAWRAWGQTWAVTHVGPDGLDEAWIEACENAGAVSYF